MVNKSDNFFWFIFSPFFYLIFNLYNRKLSGLQFKRKRIKKEEETIILKNFEK